MQDCMGDHRYKQKSLSKSERPTVSETDSAESLTLVQTQLQEEEDSSHRGSPGLEAPTSQKVKYAFQDRR